MALQASWGPTEENWGPVARFPGDWLAQRGVYCLITAAGPLDVFRSVTGLPAWARCAARALSGQTPTGVAYRGLCDADMLACQFALEESARKLDRIRTLQDSMQKQDRHEG